jgi:hypothetical protein
MFVIAFDADKHRRDDDGKPLRPAVLAAEQTLIQALLPVGDVYSAEWDERNGKGIDDLLVYGATYQLVDRYEAPVPRPRVPRPCTQPGPVDDGDSFEGARVQTAARLHGRFTNGHGNTIALIAPPPGTAKTGGGLREQEITNRNVMWAVNRHQQAEELVLRAETERCRCGTRRGDCSQHRIVLHHDRGRNAENCANFHVIEAARLAGYGARVGAWICGTKGNSICPLFRDCEYQFQFERQGSHVAPVETVTQRPTSTNQMSVVLFDDIEGGRLVSNWRITAATLDRAERCRDGQKLKSLIVTLRRALAEATTTGSYHRAAYEALDIAARGIGTTLEEVLTATPTAKGLVPSPSVDAYARAIPGQIVDLLELLHEEFPWYRAGTQFTSGLRLTAAGIDATRLLIPTAKANGDTSLTGKSVAVLSSTPDPVLRQWMGQLGLEVLGEYRPRVPLPPGVRVIQDTSGFYGKSSTQGNDPFRLIKKASAYVRKLNPQRLAVITHKHLHEAVAKELGVPQSRTLYFGNVRGSNAVRDADCLLVLGTPGMDPGDAYWLACAAYRGEASPPSRRMIMEHRPYGGWRDSNGLGREIEVLTFVDPRVAEIYESARRDELIQAIYRCRPFDVADEPGQRRALAVVLLSAMPVSGLRVDELRMGGNGARSEEADSRLQLAVEALQATGSSPTSRELAAAARTSVERAQAYKRRVSAVRSPTYIETLIQVGDQAAETPVSRTQSLSANRPDHWQPCPGACGTWMPPGQKCFACAADAVAAWKASQRSRRP